MATVTFDREGPGKASMNQVFGNGVRKIVTGKFSFDNSYPTGGEDISEIINMFSECQGITFTHFANNDAYPSVDYTNKKVKVVSGAGAERANATDLSAITNVRFIAWGR